MLNIATRAVRKGAEVVCKTMDRLDRVRVEKHARFGMWSSVETQIDYAMQAVIKEAFPEHVLWNHRANESFDAVQPQACVWVIEPLSGIGNFLHGIAHHAVSLSIWIEGQLTHAVLYDPLRDELFTATKGGGAFLNQKRLRISSHTSLEGAMIGLEEGGSSVDSMRATLKEKGVSLRQLGAESLGLAYLASGRLQGFCGHFAVPCYAAAGLLLVQEAGGLVFDYQGYADYLRHGDVIAGNGPIASAIHHCLSQAVSS